MIGKFPLSLGIIKQLLAHFRAGSNARFHAVKNADMLILETGTPTLARFIVQFCYPSPLMRFVPPKDKPHFFCLRLAQAVFNQKRLSHV